jgi:lysophospholipase L1-like esterase
VNRTTQSEMDNESMPQIGLTRDCGAASHRLRGARFRSLAAVAVFAVAVGACGSDSNSEPEAVSMETPTPPTTSMTPAGMRPASAPADETDAPSASMAATGEAPMGSVPLQTPPAPTGMEGSSGSQGETPAPDGAAEPPATEPEQPAAFNPCPTDGSACRIMPLGDSITDGLVGNGPGNTGTSVGGYRVELFRQAVADGHAIAFVGRQQNGPTGDIAGQPFPRGHEGYSGATISSGQNQIADRLDAALAANPPDIILLHIGTNDMIQAAGAAAAPGNLENLLDQITDGAPDALVVVAQIIPLGFGNAVATYNAAIPDIVQERVDAGKHMIFVDQFTPIASNPNFVAELVGDSVHPNSTGYSIMAATWYDAIESFLP